MPLGTTHRFEPLSAACRSPRQLTTQLEQAPDVPPESSAWPSGDQPPRTVVAALSRAPFIAVALPFLVWIGPSPPPGRLPPGPLQTDRAPEVRLLAAYRDHTRRGRVGALERGNNVGCVPGVYCLLGHYDQQIGVSGSCRVPGDGRRVGNGCPSCWVEYPAIRLGTYLVRLETAWSARQALACPGLSAAPSPG